MSGVCIRSIRKLAGGLAVGLLLGVAYAGVAVAQESTTRPNADVAIEAISRLRSPFCPGFMLEVCTSPNAAALRDSIYDLAEQGQTSDQIIEWMLGNHGEEYRAVPQTSGLGLWAWIIPPLAVLAAVAFALTWLRRSRLEQATAPVARPAVTEVSEQDRKKLAAAMREWEEAGEEEA